MEIKSIEELTEIFMESKSRELTVSWGDSSVYIKKSAPKKSIKKSEPKKVNLNTVSVKEPLEIKSSKVGIFYFSEKEIKIGDIINRGDVIGFVDALKIKNEVISEFSGVVKEVLVNEAYPVEYGQILLVLE